MFQIKSIKWLSKFKLYTNTWFKGTVSVISSDPPSKEGTAQRYPWNFILIKNVEDTLGFLTQIVLIYVKAHIAFINKKFAIHFSIEKPQCKYKVQINKNIDI